MQMLEIIQHMCSEVDFPFCRIFEMDPCKYASRTTLINKIHIYSPSTLILLFTVIICTIRMLQNVKRHYSAIGRKEMKTFFYLYITATIIDIILLSRVFPFAPHILLLIVSIQLSIACTTLFCLLVGSMTTLYMFSYHVFQGNVVTNVLSTAYLLAITPIIYAALHGKNSWLFVGVVFLFNGFLVIGYVFFQFHTLKSLNTEIWAYGTLFIGAVCFIIGIIPLGFGSEIIVKLCERYLDGLFFFHLFIFCAIIMIHKFWLSICECEAECPPLIVKKKPESVYRE